MERREMWERLELFSRTNSLPWAVGGDFNAVMSPLEKAGGRPVCSASIEEFGSSSGLIDVGTVSGADNAALLLTPSLEEVKEAVFALSCDSAPGPDGFSGHFFTACWETGRAASVLSVGGVGCFCAGRCIHDNIAIVQEVAHDLNRKARGGNVILKLDMAKAYDRMEWDFLWRGSQTSPALFILAEEVLSRGIRKLFEEGHASYYRLPRGCPGISHCLYADDTIIFTRGLRGSLKQIMGLLCRYEGSSGQLVNWQKSCFVVGARASMAKALMVGAVTGFLRRSLPITYLGAPLHSGRVRIDLFNSMVAKIRNRVAGWMGRLLSYGGRVTLLKHVLASMPIHVLTTLDQPQDVIRRVYGIFADFLWGNSEWGKRRHWVCWNKICRPVEEGGLGVRRLEDVGLSLRLKGFWRVLADQSLWSTFFRAKLFRNLHVSLAGPLRAASKSWRSTLSYKEFMLDKSRWLLGRGRVSF
ncbi:uncharacterized protein LOC122659103 [Telopea speciosissima]|uniref:uncharacterized protein LOC122659103 n=1 Tax=Telopea speciosissima TaxID=54955 RepID=UPI001CC5140F|nr:uncharacterized protein LOC122659103 [Telopea speciosissima]